VYFFSKFGFTEDASDFDLQLSYDATTQSYATLNFAETEYASAEPWQGFTVCFWVKLEVWSEITLLTYYAASENIVFRVSYIESKDKMWLHGYDNTR